MKTENNRNILCTYCANPPTDNKVLYDIMARKGHGNFNDNFNFFCLDKDGNIHYKVYGCHITITRAKYAKHHCMVTVGTRENTKKAVSVLEIIAELQFQKLCELSEGKL